MSDDTEKDARLVGVGRLTPGVGGLKTELSKDWTERSGAGLKGELWAETGPSSRKRGLMMARDGDWTEGLFGARIGPSSSGRCLRGRCRVGSQRSVNSGDVMRARWRKGEPVIQLPGVGA